MPINYKHFILQKLHIHVIISGKQTEAQGQWNVHAVSRDGSLGALATRRAVEVLSSWSHNGVTSYYNTENLIGVAVMEYGEWCMDGRLGVK